jgi:hypothetical protein
MKAADSHKVPEPSHTRQERKENRVTNVDALLAVILPLSLSNGKSPRILLCSVLTHLRSTSAEGPVVTLACRDNCSCR